MSKIAIIIAQMVKFIIGNDECMLLPQLYTIRTHTKKHRPLPRFVCHCPSALSLSNAEEYSREAHAKEEEKRNKRASCANCYRHPPNPPTLSPVRLCGKVNLMPAGCPLHNANGTLFPSHGDVYTQSEAAHTHNAWFSYPFCTRIRSCNDGLCKTRRRRGKPKKKKRMSM